MREEEKREEKKHSKNPDFR